jgi:hypothetical protein
VRIHLAAARAHVLVYASAVRQGVAGYPNNGQLSFYVLFPVAMTLLSACFYYRCEKTARSGVHYPIAHAVCIDTSLVIFLYWRYLELVSN